MNKLSFKNKNIVVLGGTGSFGKAFIHYLLKHHSDLNQILVVSRDEQKQYEFKSELGGLTNKITFSLGDIRDRERMFALLSNADMVVHAAAMKHMPIAEENPQECYKTNIVGTQNVIDSAIANKVEKVVALSTDKAVLPINVYGASKLFLERLVINANISQNNTGTKLMIVRYANVLGSRGSVVPFFQKVKSSGTIPITDLKMTRFSITLQDSVDLVLYAFAMGTGGEVIVPKAPSYKITDVASAIAPDCQINEIGIRNGEKLSELMLSKHESLNTLENEKYFIVLPPFKSQEAHVSHFNARPLTTTFEYDSANNTDWLTVERLKEQIMDL
ncbi:SDR family NAD(P)-dependent oxidoreductase [Marivirga sp. S37H4]|uniref:SDR family NAD(P)-dependent oxidoreductase n=1 Tax=Marivirga aurantiaca TaxID=2802615 RepID=A0A934X2C8_9BACT|nr:SDR family NAD(P)-dependent oxidoreductase [Marivirga aurantiaca]MBK6267016.1 SDR family NAD(P)-dependent oxidoreductase [Marivirga aurantiaca]